MALNFPANTSGSYIDPSSGLKYIYNYSVGAWEAAVQPPAIVANATPNVNISGFLYFNNSDKKLYINVDGTSTGWIQTIPTASFPIISSGGNTPANPTLNTLWFDSDKTKRLYIAYQPAGSSQIRFIDASPSSFTPGKPASSIGVAPPINPEPGALWWNSVDGNMYVWYVEGPGDSAWVVSNTTAFGAGGGIGKISAITPLRVGGTTALTTLSIDNATDTLPGVARIATQSEATSGTDNTTIITPRRLKQAVDDLMPVATASVAGKIEVATQAEVTEGTDGSKAVTPLTLKRNLTTLGYDNIPAGAIVMWPSATIPDGWLECNGMGTQGYPALAKVVGKNIPDLRGIFVRGWANDSLDNDAGRKIKSTQQGENKTHAHGVLDDGHTHKIVDDGHAHSANADPHTHTYSRRDEISKIKVKAGNDTEVVRNTDAVNNVNTGSASPSVKVNSARSGIEINEARAGISMKENGIDDGPRPKNIALMYIIKT
jgi:hypothetical protein